MTYTASDIDRMRAATKIMVGGAGLVSYGQSHEHALGKLANSQIIEDRLRTSIAAGLSPDDLERTADVYATKVLSKSGWRGPSFKNEPACHDWLERRGRPIPETIKVT